MNISAHVALSPGDPQVDPEAAGVEVLQALGGDPSKDSCTLTVTLPPVTSGNTQPPQPQQTEQETSAE